MRIAPRTWRASNALASFSSSTRCRATPPGRYTNPPFEACSVRLALPGAPTPPLRKVSMFAPERAELKFLRRAPWGDMLMSPAVGQCEAASQRRGQTALVVTIDKEPAASFRPVRRERGDDGVAA